MKYPKPVRYQNDKYLDYIRSHPCCFCGKGPPSIAHHASFIEGSGQGTKPSDLFTIPLCFICHHLQHSGHGLSKEFIAITMVKLLANWIKGGGDGAYRPDNSDT